MIKHSRRIQTLSIISIACALSIPMFYVLPLNFFVYNNKFWAWYLLVSIILALASLLVFLASIHERLKHGCWNKFFWVNATVMLIPILWLYLILIESRAPVI